MGAAEQSRQGDFLELFFDLVFVVALAQLSQGLAQRLGWIRAFQTLVLLTALWLVWSITVWITDLHQPQRPSIQLLVAATMLGTLLMVVALPDAFGRQGLVFAGAYVTIHVGRQVFLFLVQRGQELQRRSIRVLCWFAASAVPWIVGATLPATARGILWALAITMDVTGGILRYPTPGMGRSPKSEYPIGAEHLAERYRQLFIIALGELILVTALTLSASGFATYRTTAFVVSFVGTVTYWRIYIYQAGELLPAAIAAAPDPDRLARLVATAHQVMLAGVVATAVGDELVIAHPLGHARPAWVAAILGGPALFLAGRAALEYAVFGRMFRDRVIGVFLLAVLTPPMLLVPPLFPAIAAVAVLAGIAIADTGRRRRHPQEPPPPRARPEPSPAS